MALSDAGVSSRDEPSSGVDIGVRALELGSRAGRGVGKDTSVEVDDGIVRAFGKGIFSLDASEAPKVPKLENPDGFVSWVVGGSFFFSSFGLPNANPTALPKPPVFSPGGVGRVGAVDAPKPPPKEKPPLAGVEALGAPVLDPKVSVDPAGVEGKEKGFDGALSIALVKLHTLDSTASDINAPGLSLEGLRGLLEVLGPIGLKTNFASGPREAADLVFHTSSLEEEELLAPNVKVPFGGTGGAPKSNIGFGVFVGFGGLVFFGPLFCLAASQDAGVSNLVNVDCEASLIDIRHFWYRMRTADISTKGSRFS
jgi:hypothetical protein